MNYWLLKSEPDVYSWDNLVRDGATCWDGIRNHQAAGFLKKMQPSDQAFIYHTGGERRIMGIAEVTRSSYPDKSDASCVFVCVDVKPVRPLAAPIGLDFIKQSGLFPDFLLLKQGRLSVVPVQKEYWLSLTQQTN